MKKALGVLGIVVLGITISTAIGCQNQPEAVVPVQRTQAEKDKINAGRGGAKPSREDGAERRSPRGRSERGRGRGRARR